MKRYQNIERDLMSCLSNPKTTNKLKQEIERKQLYFGISWTTIEKALLDLEKNGKIRLLELKTNKNTTKVWSIK